MFDWFNDTRFRSWIKAGSTEIFMVAVSSVCIYAALILLTRINGLRSFSNMSSFDFAITVAFGSLIASTLLAAKPSLAHGLAGLVTLFIVHRVTAVARRHSALAEAALGNKPMLLMAGSEVLQGNLDRTRVTNEDLKSRLREAGITHTDQVSVAITESTGGVSVMKKGDEVDFQWFENITGAGRLRSLSSASRSDHQPHQTQAIH